MVIDAQFSDIDPRTESELLEDCAWIRLAKHPEWPLTPELLFAMKRYLEEEKAKKNAS